MSPVLRKEQGKSQGLTSCRALGLPGAPPLPPLPLSPIVTRRTAQGLLLLPGSPGTSAPGAAFPHQSQSPWSCCVLVCSGEQGVCDGAWFMLILWHLAQQIISINTIQILLIFINRIFYSLCPCLAWGLATSACPPWQGGLGGG